MTSINEYSIISPPTGRRFNNFGRTLESNGNYCLITANYLFETGSVDGGVVYVYKYNGTSWSQLTNVFNNGSNNIDYIYNSTDGSNNYFFGNSTDISSNGEWIVIGENLYNNGDGKIYIFKNNGSDFWTKQSIIQPLFVSSGDRLGTSVSIDGNYIVVGAPNDDTTSTDAGSVAVYKLSSGSWSEIESFQGRDGAVSDAQGNDNFGSAVAISGDFIIVGATGSGDGTNEYGSIYIYKNNGSDSFTSINTYKYTGLSSYNILGSEKVYLLVVIML